MVGFRSLGSRFELWLLATALLTCRHAQAVDVDYVTQIKPILTEKCYSCHGALKQESELRLETRELIDRGGESGSVLVPGRPDESELFLRIASSGGDRMPPPDEGSALKTDEIKLLRSWIQQGAEAPVEEIPASPRDHWAFQKVVRPPIPENGFANPIDALLEQARQQQGLSTQSLATRSLAIRRLYLDLIGLPPTREQLNDQRAWEEIVDGLLADPAHAERWARHWMDVWRYTDWYGLGAQLRFSQKHMWHWRDWIIDSLACDKGYDRMVMQMVAGDELAPEDVDAIAGTGFLARNYYLFNRTTWLDATIEHTGKAFLGLTFNCAKCHDHKYDPVSQLDYYRLRAVFEPHQVRLDPVAGETDFAKNGLPRVFDDHIDEPTYLHVRGNPKDIDKSTVISPGVPQFLSSFESEIQSIQLPPSAFAPGTRDYVEKDHIDRARQQIAVAERAVEAVKAKSGDAKSGDAEADDAEADDEKQLSIATARLQAAQASLVSLQATIAADRRAFENDSDPAEQTRRAREAAIAQASARLTQAKVDLLTAKDEKQKQAAETKVKQAEQQIASAEQGTTQYQPLKASFKALETPEHKEVNYPASYSPVSSGRRLALARWIVSPENPLTARVAVNHVWMRHFGTPLVESVFDFGLRAKEPKHRRLLDLLAAEFMDSGWSFKHLHRLIVTSEAYRLESSSLGADPATRNADPENQYYWRMNARRMESQVVRDSLLAIAGELDRSVGGPSIDPKNKSARRSIYFLHSRDQQDRFLSMFDDADLMQCYRRQESIVPQQALALSNSLLSFEASERIADVVTASLDSGDAENFIAAVYQSILGRGPDSEEVRHCHQFLTSTEQNVSSDGARVRALLVHALLNHNDFVTIR